MFLAVGSLYSGLSSKARSSTTESAHTDSETATQTNSEASTGMRTSSSMSTIDTVRLIKAFGPERVRPSSKLSRLYSTIDLQKKRTVEISKKQKSPKKMADTDSVMSSNGSWEPSPALRHKRSGKVLNKGIQTGELEIVMSATRKNTRDVGTTFPSPGGELTVTCAQGSPGQRGSLIHQPLQPDDVKSDDRKENKRTAQRGPGPVWFEPMSNAKPWREPLREKNEQDEVPRRADHLLNRSQLISDAQSKSPRPFVKITLQESLKTHRPKFIFRSGERVKRLRLLAKERKLQNMFQNERDELFNQPVPREVSNYQNPYKDSRKSQRNDSIPRKEMVQRSKRIYEQLPEIKRRKEEEKRRSEYESYRLKAQLFRKKVTNNILGRKTPWN
ncbi:centrosome-associated protein ALMS1-like isoform X2 [Mixophyes fleayi]|uniref:centrosome-associated protein ALMS1-like isoform X2 n=1 Tax=Mixophyes fleayi TaxID=3061075 RepID=UPI003F4E3FD0